MTLNFQQGGGKLWKKKNGKKKAAKRKNGKKKNGKPQVLELHPIIFIIHLINHFNFCKKILTLLRNLYVLMKSISDVNGSSCSTRRRQVQTQTM
jgi:hypothetical protein